MLDYDYTTSRCMQGTATLFWGTGNSVASRRVLLNVNGRLQYNGSSLLNWTYPPLAISHL
jgi:hypothetical protein